MPSAKPYTAKQIAGLLGLCPQQFYALREHLHQVDKLPLPLTSTRHMRWERSGVDCWLLRHHPYAPKLAPANDLVPRPLEAPSIEDEQAELAREYARK